MWSHPVPIRGLLVVLVFWLSPIVGAAAMYPPIPMTPQPLESSGIVVDYPIAYISCPRTVPSTNPQLPMKSAPWAEFGHPYNVAPGCDLRVRWPDGSTELLVAGGTGAIQDPAVSLDGSAIYYTRFHMATAGANQYGADLEKIDLATRAVTRLTQQAFAPHVPLPMRFGVYNMHPCPLPDGSVIYTSNRNAYLPRPESYPEHALQLHRLEPNGAIELIGMLNLGSALHPTLLLDGQVMFSSLENMGSRHPIEWGVWRMDPFGRTWAPIWSAFFKGGSPNGAHFQTPLADGSLVIEQYYNQNQKGFGALYSLPPTPPGQVSFLSSDLALVPPLLSLYEIPGERSPFQPRGLQKLTPWINPADLPAKPSVYRDNTSPFIGKVTHPAAAPDGHLFVVWSPGPIGGSSGAVTSEMGPVPIDSGVYLIRDAAPTTGPADLIQLLNTPERNEAFPVPVVTYQRRYGQDPRPIARTTYQDAVAQRHLSPGSPFGLVGTASLRKRESAPYGRVVPGSVTAHSAWDPQAHGVNCRSQGCDSGVFTNDDIAALRILYFEPNAARTQRSHPRGYRHYPQYTSQAMERLRYHDLPVLDPATAPLDPDGEPDTSFLAKIPGDVPFTFALIGRDGAMLSLSQTWHQVRPGEARYDCGGCHAHSQQPTPFEETLAGQPTFMPHDATGPAPLIEFTASIRPLLQATCTGCHNPTTLAGTLDLQTTTISEGVPRDYLALILAQNATGGIDAHGIRYVTKLQARCSPLLWLLGSPRPEQCSPRAILRPTPTVNHATMLADTELRILRTFIDTGALLAYSPDGLRDDTPPTVAIADPVTAPWDAVIVGLYDYQSGLDLASLSIRVQIQDGGTSGWRDQDIAAACQPLDDHRWQCGLPSLVTPPVRATVDVRIRDTSGVWKQQSRQVTMAAPVGEAPVIVASPPSTMFARPCVGPLQASLTATGTPPLMFQWFQNGTPVAGATAATYTPPCWDPALLPLTVSCEVRNAFGVATCPPAVMTLE